MAEQMIYRAFEGEELIYEGTRKGLLDALHISHSTPIRRYASEGTLVLGRYRFTVSYKEGKFTQCQEELFQRQLNELRKKRRQSRRYGWKAGGEHQNAGGKRNKGEAYREQGQGVERSTEKKKESVLHSGGHMKNKEFYDLTKVDVIADYKVNGCGKIIPSRRLITILYDGKRITPREETGKSVYRYLLDWAEEEKKDECQK